MSIGGIIQKGLVGGLGELGWGFCWWGFFWGSSGVLPGFSRENFFYRVLYSRGWLVGLGNWGGVFVGDFCLLKIELPVLFV